MAIEAVPIQVPQTHGYHDGTLSQEVLMSLCRNMSLARSLPTRRPGYAVRRQQGTTEEYTERIPCDEIDGTLRACFLLWDVLYVDKATPSSLETLAVDPWAAVANALPSWAYAYARTVLVNGLDFRILMASGGDPTSREELPDPGNPTLTTPAGGSMTAGTWYVRIRWYDEATETWSGPDNRVTTAQTAAPAVGNLSIDVDISAISGGIPTRATHWQIQLVMTTDAPSGYEIHYTPGDTTGKIPVGTTSVTLTTDPSSGDRFPFQTTDAAVVYRHANPPLAHFVCFHRGRWFYGANNQQWIVWSDVGNPEHFYHDTTDPSAGLNSAEGDGIGNSMSGALTGIFSNQFQSFFAQRGDIHVGTGSWAEVYDETGVFVQRNAFIEPLAANGAGAVSSKWVGVDQEVFFISPRGPSVISNGKVEVLASDAIRALWNSRDRAVEHRFHVTYDPDGDLVLFSLATQSTEAKPDLVLAWSRAKKLWCPPWTLRTSSLGLMRFQTDGGTDRGLRAMAGSWSGGQLELGVSDGDGWEGDDADAAGFQPASVTTTSITKTAAGWTVNEFASFSIVIVDPDGKWYYRQVLSNTSDTITWTEPIADIANNHYVFIGGIPEVWHTVLADAKEIELRGVKLVLDDQPSRVGAS